MAQQQQGAQSLPSPVSENDESAQMFAAVLSSIDMQQLPRLATSLLQSMQPDHSAANTKPSIGEPLYGSYHVLFPMKFDSDLQWVARFPINGTENKWDELSASALTSEAKTMRLLKRETTIPLPDVLAFSATTDNSLRCPYIIMSFISGKPLYDVWFGQHSGISPDITRERRIRALEGIAAAMVQLGKFSFSSSGCPLFGTDGNISGLGKMRFVDHSAMLDRWFVHNGPDDDPLFLENTPSSDPKVFYTSVLNMYPPQQPFDKGVVMLLQQLISWIPNPTGMDPFVLSHPDSDIQNFIVSEDGELRGIIDWDGIAALPRTLGNESYPSWLTRDWDPMMYGYKEPTEDGVEIEGLWEDSPETLAHYRAVYKDIIARHLRDTRLDYDHSNLCQMSLITENLAIAAHNPQCRDGIIRKVIHEIWVAAEVDGEEPSMVDVVEMFVENKVDNEVFETLRKGFEALLSKPSL
ncbi:hypothetical protein BGZ63DRAFT_404912 [Mariannaea sp. PMI_226]|nr:hypothetical protein BGZ63DRAFT_404912 [Mariannaea sp. PMI_226]